MIILYVDDDAEDAELFCEAVKTVDEAFKCVIAYNGNQAMDILNTGLLPDYIFLDINMPVMGGDETLKAIRRNKTFQELPVIMYSTTINPNKIEEYKRLGATTFLIKPPKFQDLCNALSSVLK